MNTKEINGFTEIEVVNLYRFIYLYEKGGIDNYNTLKEVYNNHPALEDTLPSCLNKLKLHISCLDKIQNVDLDTYNNEIIFTKNKNRNKVQSFLAHLRNSIAHGLIYKKGKLVYIIDYSIIKPTSFSTRGTMDYDIFIELIGIINKHINEL